MNDPRKPVLKQSPEREEAIRQLVLGHLFNATQLASAEIGCTGAAFVLISAGIFLGELTEINQRAAVDYYRALADMSDPSLDERARGEANMRRSAALKEIYASLDLFMAGAQGNA